MGHKGHRIRGYHATCNHLVTHLWTKWEEHCTINYHLCIIEGSGIQTRSVLDILPDFRTKTKHGSGHKGHQMRGYLATWNCPCHLSQIGLTKLWMRTNQLIATQF